MSAALAAALCESGVCSVTARLQSVWVGTGHVRHPGGRSAGGDDPWHCAAIEEQARIIVADAEREVAQPADLGSAHAEAESVFHAEARRRS